MNESEGSGGTRFISTLRQAKRDHEMSFLALRGSHARVMIGKDASKTEPLRMREKPSTGTLELTTYPPHTFFAPFVVDDFPAFPVWVGNTLC